MAYLGVIGKVTPDGERAFVGGTSILPVPTKDGLPNVRARREAVWANSPQYPLLLANLTGHYAGVITQQGVPMAGHRVLLFWREPVALAQQLVSGADGSFNFTELIPGTDNYFIVVLDKAGGVVQNALIFDKVTPVV